MKINCPNCKTEIEDIVRFCPNCGIQISKAGAVISKGKKVRIYIASFFLTPLGLFWFFKYIKSSDPENKKVAIISLILTLVPLIYMAVIVTKYISMFSGDLGTYTSTIDTYSDLGF